MLDKIVASLKLYSVLMLCSYWIVHKAAHYETKLSVKGAMIPCQTNKAKTVQHLHAVIILDLCNHIRIANFLLVENLDNWVNTA
jgi:hypothetical protein